MVRSSRGPLKGHMHAFPFAYKPKAGATPYACESGYRIGSTRGEDQPGLRVTLHGQEAQLGGSSTQIHFQLFLKDDYYDYYYYSAQAP